MTIFVVSGLWRKAGRKTPLDDFFQLTTVEPDSAAFRAIVNFDTLFIGYRQRNITNRAVHGISSNFDDK
jgi:hypothetical protein